MHALLFSRHRADRREVLLDESNDLASCCGLGVWLDAFEQRDPYILRNPAPAEPREQEESRQLGVVDSVAAHLGQRCELDCQIPVEFRVDGARSEKAKRRRTDARLDLVDGGVCRKTQGRLRGVAVGRQGPLCVRLEQIDRGLQAGRRSGSDNEMGGELDFPCGPQPWGNGCQKRAARPGDEVFDPPFQLAGQWVEKAGPVTEDQQATGIVAVREFFQTDGGLAHGPIADARVAVVVEAFDRKVLRFQRRYEMIGQRRLVIASGISLDENEILGGPRARFEAQPRVSQRADRVSNRPADGQVLCFARLTAQQRAHRGAHLTGVVEVGHGVALERLPGQGFPSRAMAFDDGVAETPRAQLEKREDQQGPQEGQPE